ncbi:DUF6932 family protein [Mucilaginibacter sp. FT3.2]|uniref:DUF6932 family protein n=1 Tax=Mucilaginibacter sp. FT3.2 TaxID=2723090 RepID=UPI0016074264|nr:hypothetical protein [Mucilaginibacter sp. FT3.2]MBB6230740.1 hypothetical protein [Mucilaginibacter sp. FT3.2]
MLTFNNRGLLIPENIIPSTLEEFEIEFAINEDKRSQLFEQYKLYCHSLKAVCDNKPITQWIDGSYVTKSKNPSDIDLVFFLDHETVKTKEKELKQFIYPQSMALYGIDAYIIVIYPHNNKYAYHTDADKAYWIDHFGNTKPNRSRKKIPKGFLEIII